MADSNEPTLKAKALSAIENGDVKIFSETFSTLNEEVYTGDLFDAFGAPIIARENTAMLDVLNKCDPLFENFSELMRVAVSLRKPKMVTYIADTMIGPRSGELRLAIATGDADIIKAVAFHREADFSSDLASALNAIFTSGHDLLQRLKIRSILTENDDIEDSEIIDAAGRHKDGPFLLAVSATYPDACLAASIRHDVGVDSGIISAAPIVGPPGTTTRVNLELTAFQTAIRRQKTDIALKYLQVDDEKLYIEAAAAGMTEVLRRMKTPPIAVLTTALKKSLAHFDVVGYLVSRGAGVQNNWLLPAVEAGNKDVVAFLIEIPSIKARKPFLAELKRAVGKNNLAVATLLAERDPESAKNSELVIIAAKNRSIPMIKLLAKYDANVLNVALLNRIELFDMQTGEALAKDVTDAELAAAMDYATARRNDKMIWVIRNETSERRYNRSLIERANRTSDPTQ